LSCILKLAAGCATVACRRFRTLGIIGILHLIKNDLYQRFWAYGDTCFAVNFAFAETGRHALRPHPAPVTARFLDSSAIFG
jgi:hypothetical protein